jgi:hypothetical protein
MEVDAVDFELPTASPEENSGRGSTLGSRRLD